MPVPKSAVIAIHTTAKRITRAVLNAAKTLMLPRIAAGLFCAPDLKLWQRLHGFIRKIEPSKRAAYLDNIRSGCYP